jgi:hypothetical protein
MPSFRGLDQQDEFVDVAKSRGLSSEQVRKRFIRYKDFTEIGYWAPGDAAVAAVAFDSPMLIGLQAVNRTATI